MLHKVSKVKVFSNPLLKTDAVIKNQRANRESISLIALFNEFIQFNIIAPVNIDSLTTGSNFLNLVIIQQKDKVLKTVLDARQINALIDETIRSQPIVSKQLIV